MKEWWPKAWIIGLLVLLLAACATPLRITGVAMTSDGCDCTCVSWTTNIPARSQLSYCQNGICSMGYAYPEYTLDHGDGVPAGAEHIAIKAESEDGQVVLLEVK